MACYHAVPSVLITNLKTGKRRVIYDYRSSNVWQASFFDPENFSIEYINLPCNKCIGCYLQRSLDWSCRICCEKHTREYLHNNPYSSFITLTYDNENLPKDQSVSPLELQSFMKRLREFYSRYFGVKDIKFFACGEYGEQFHRPHYHIIVLGLDFFEVNRLKLIKDKKSNKILSKLESANPRYLEAPQMNSASTFDSPILSRLWNKGRVAIGSVTPQSVAYTARYCCKKLVLNYTKVDNKHILIERDGQDCSVHPEFIRMSKRFGLEFFEKYYRDIYVNNEVSVGFKDFAHIPRYFDKQLENLDNELYQNVKSSRLEYMASERFLKDNTPLRLEAKEHIKLVAMETRLLRNYERSGDFFQEVERNLIS
ncbi:replication initiator protein [Capybara microvirus Cap3_SP_442]|nr:replication initiator protein [Capybara microvirus Cap3_SP_442]